MAPQDAERENPLGSGRTGHLIPRLGGVLRWGCRSFVAKNKDPYSRLNAEQKEFRLLEIYPGFPGDGLSLFLRRANLSSPTKPVYGTISYCLGDPANREELSLNGHLYNAPSTAVAAIERVRLPNRKRAIWIDAICINQASKEERAQQVLLMNDIYRNGTANLIYLGEQGHLTEESVDLINFMLEELKKITAGWSTFVRAMFEDWDLGTSLDGVRDVRFLDEIYARPWFQ